MAVDLCFDCGCADYMWDTLLCGVTRELHFRLNNIQLLCFLYILLILNYRIPVVCRIPYMGTVHNDSVCLLSCILFVEVT